jgi:hypothetical protein
MRSKSSPICLSASSLSEGEGRTILLVGSIIYFLAQFKTVSKPALGSKKFLTLSSKSS